MAELIAATSLPAIISASKLVTGRLDFLRALEILVFDPQSRKLLLERSQLHRILEHYTWLFGEEFSLSASDQSLNEVLRKHLKILGRTEDTETPVLRARGKKGIVDLMLSRRIPQIRAEEREHLVVELKRPDTMGSLTTISQVKSYAFAVANDERFRNSQTRWIFWLVTNDLDEEARRDTRQRHRPEGLAHDDEELRVQVWCKTWGELIDACRGRLQFFQKALDYEATDEAALALLKEKHEQAIPPHLAARAS